MNPTFYKTIVTSKQWQEWIKYQEKEIKFDVHESLEMDWLSPEHFQAFIKWIEDRAIIREYGVKINESYKPRNI